MIKIFNTLFIFSLCLSFFCSSSKQISGIYYSHSGAIQSIEFKDGKCYIIAIMGINAGAWDYKIKNKDIYVKNDKDGYTVFKIINDKVLECNDFGLAGKYIKK